MQYEEIIKKLKSLSNPKNVTGMARFGINSKNTLGVSIPQLRKLGKQIGKNPAYAPADAKAMAGKKASAGRHDLAQELWDSKIHEARILASIVDDQNEITEKQMDKWVRDFDSWDVCDQVCMNLFDKTKFWDKKAIQWTRRKEEFVKRAGFAIIAAAAFHRKDVGEKFFLKFLPIITRESLDERNFVKKSINWALRQIGKRSEFLNKAAIAEAEKIAKINSKSAKWIAADALRELKSEAVKKRFKATKLKI